MSVGLGDRRVADLHQRLHDAALAGLQVRRGVARMRCGHEQRRTAGQLGGEEQVGELALAVGPPRVVGPLAHQVVEGDAADPVGAAGDDHDPGVLAEEGEQAAGQREVTEVVGAELQLEAIGGQRAGRRHDPGVANEQVQPAGASGDIHRCGLDTRQRGEVQRHQLGRGTRDLEADPSQGGLRPLRVTAGHQHPRALAGQLQRGVEPDPGVGAGHEGGSSGLVWQVCGGPSIAHADEPATSAHHERHVPGPARVVRRASGLLPTQVLLVEAHELPDGHDTSRRALVRVPRARLLLWRTSTMRRRRRCSPRPSPP